MPSRLKLLLVLLLAVVGAAVWRFTAAPPAGPGLREYTTALRAQRTGDLDAAIRSLRLAILAEPGNGEFHAELGNLYLQGGRFDHAAASLEMAAYLTPERPHVFCQLGQALVEERRREEALAALEKGLQKSPDCPHALSVRGEQLLRDDNLKAALEDFRRVVALQPDFGLAYQKLGYILLETNQTEEAIRVLQKGLEVSRGHPGIQFLLGYAYSRRPSDPDSVRLAEQFYRLSLPRNAERARVHTALGQLYLRSSRLEEAGKEFQEALALSPYQKDALYGLTQVRQREGRAAEAEGSRRLYDRFLTWERELSELQARVAADPRDVDGQLRLARLLIEKRLFQDAARPLHMAVLADPARREVRELRALVFDQSGQKERANREYVIASRLPGTSKP